MLPMQMKTKLDKNSSWGVENLRLKYRPLLHSSSIRTSRQTFVKNSGGYIRSDFVTEKSTDDGGRGGGVGSETIFHRFPVFHGLSQ